MGRGQKNSIGLLCCLPRAPLRLAPIPHPPEKSNSWNCGNADYNSRDQIEFAKNTSLSTISVPHPRRAVKGYPKGSSILFGAISIHFQPPGATLGCFSVLGNSPVPGELGGGDPPRGRSPTVGGGAGGGLRPRGPPMAPAGQINNQLSENIIK